ncbi:MAG: GGDEF domain-containing protein [Gemmatimonadaceae bacterium]|nr:GGDEF domain-containing protein [Gemmatimonadaceae bacterium]
MFFSRHSTSNAAPVATVSAPSDDVGPVLDALGQVLAQYTQHIIDLPDRPANEAREQLEGWRRHAVMGTPIPGVERSAGGEDNSGGISHRNWIGVTQAFSTHRRDERRYVETALTDLREALWTCVERSHQALLAEQHHSPKADAQVARVRTALDRLETGAVKNEIAQAMLTIEQLTQARQDSQREAFVQLAARIEQLGSQLEEARRASETDTLTGLGNRLAFERALGRISALHALGGQPLSVVVIDLDFLKVLNDVHGHHVGDAALVALANTLPRVFLREADVTCRLGGDEFAVLLPGTPLTLAERLTDRFRARLAALPWEYSEQAGPLSASAGAAQWQSAEVISDWLRRADAAMYQVKLARTRPTA